MSDAAMYAHARAFVFFSARKYGKEGERLGKTRDRAIMISWSPDRDRKKTTQIGRLEARCQTLAKKHSKNNY